LPKLGGAVVVNAEDDVDHLLQLVLLHVLVLEQEVVGGDALVG